MNWRLKRILAWTGLCLLAFGATYYAASAAVEASSHDDH